MSKLKKLTITASVLSLLIPVASALAQQADSGGQFTMPAAMGTVSSISGSTIILTGQNGTSYTVDTSGAEITKMVAGSSSAAPTSNAISLADIQTGDTLAVFGTVSGSSIAATKIMDGLPMSGGGNGRTGSGGQMPFNASSTPPSGFGKPPSGTSTPPSGLSGQGTKNTASSGQVIKYSNGQLINENGTVFIVYKNTKSGFANADVFKALGYSFKNVITVKNSGLTDSGYVVTKTNAQHPWGTWVKDGSTIYFVYESGLIPISSWSVFTGNGGKANYIVKANSYDLALTRLDVMTSNDSRLK
jgi:hypothetical protein